MRPKKAIPPIAAAILALTGCGDSADEAQFGEGGMGGAAGVGGVAGVGGAAGSGGAAAAGGAAGTGGGVGVDSGGDLPTAIETFCMTQLDCAYTEDLARCVESNLGTRIVEVATEPCELALASYFDCLSSLGCERILSCEDEAIIDALEAECELPGK